MAGKNDTAETSWRPIAQKLSGLIIRNGSGKSKKSPAPTDEKASVFRFKARNLKKGPFADNPREFKPLDVDLDILEAFRLAEGWLESHGQDGDQIRKKPAPAQQQQQQLLQQKQQQQQQQQQRPPALDDGTTPIARQFAGTSVLNFQTSDQHSRSNSQTHDANYRRPFSMVENQTTTYTRVSVDLNSVRDVPATGSILDRGRPVEARHYATEPLRKTKSLRQEQPLPQTGTVALQTTGALRETPLKPVRYASVGSDSVAKKQNLTPQLRPTGNLDPTNRHSMYAGVTPSLNSVAARTRIAQAPRSVSATPLDRIQAWQKSVTSAPTSAALASTTIPGVSSQGSGPARKVSTRGVMGNRLAWIRELEEKKSSSVNRDVGILKKQLGSVSDKLAMFESKQAQNAPAVSRLPPLTRSNSTTSRLSSVGLESTSAYGNITATPRTSIDTAPSSHRASSVMSYYDDTFREKMETLVSGYSAEKDKSDKSDTKKQRVSVQFIEVASKKGEEEPRSSQPEANAVNVKSETEKAEEPAPSQVEAEIPAATLEKEKVDKPESSQVDAEISNATSGTDKAAEEIESLPVEAETLNATTETEQTEEKPESSPVEEETLNATSETEKAEEEPESLPVEAETLNATTETVQAEEEPKSLPVESETLSTTAELEKAEEPESSHPEPDSPTSQEDKAEDQPESSEVEAEVSQATSETETPAVEPESCQAGAETVNVTLETDQIEEPESSQLEEVDTSNATLETEVLEAAPEEAEISNVTSETEKAEELESHQTEAEASVATPEMEKVEEQFESSQVEVETPNVTSETEEEAEDESESSQVEVDTSNTTLEMEEAEEEPESSKVEAETLNTQKETQEEEKTEEA